MAMSGHGNRYRYDEGHLGMCGMDTDQLFFVCLCYFGSLVLSRQQASRIRYQRQRKREEEDMFLFKYAHCGSACTVSLKSRDYL